MTAPVESLQRAGYVVRPARLADAAAATELYNACCVAEFGEPDYADGELEAEWSGRDLAKEVLLVIAPAGTLAAALVVDHRGHVVVNAQVYVHPEHTGRGLGTFLVGHSEELALKHVALAPPDARVVVRNVINGANPEANALLKRLGYTSVRQFYRMVIDLTEPPATPGWPAGLVVCPCAPGDERAIFATIDEAFRDHWSMGPSSFEEWERRHKAEGFDPGLWLQVLAGDEMVAAAICQLWAETGWIHEVGVRGPWRRRGIAGALLQHIFGEFYRRGMTRVGLGVDSQNLTGATRLYERVGMRRDREFAYYEKVLHEGMPGHDAGS